MTIHWFRVDSMMFFLLASVPYYLDCLSSSVHSTPPTENPNLIQVRNVMDVYRNFICYYNLRRDRKNIYVLNNSKEKRLNLHKLQKIFQNWHWYAVSAYSFLKLFLSTPEVLLPDPFCSGPLRSSSLMLTHLPTYLSTVSVFVFYSRKSIIRKVIQSSWNFNLQLKTKNSLFSVCNFLNVFT